jgi:hypothetical protein
LTRKAKASPVDWGSERDYVALYSADRTAFAWEWLRRSAAYRQAWTLHENGLNPSSGCAAFGLVRFENPDLPVPIARPIWSHDIDPNVLVATVVDPLAGHEDRIDLLYLSHLVTLHVGTDDIEHVLLSDGCHSLRIDLIGGTLVGCPSSLSYKVQGLSRLGGPLATLERLVQVTSIGRFVSGSACRHHARFIRELRIADALASGASHQDAARAIYGSLVPAHRWRVDNSSLRQRVQRLARAARARLSNPLDPRWFAQRQGERTGRSARRHAEP